MALVLGVRVRKETVTTAKAFLIPLLSGLTGWLARHTLYAPKSEVLTAVAATSAFWLITFGVGILAINGGL